MGAVLLLCIKAVYERLVSVRIEHKNMQFALFMRKNDINYRRTQYLLLDMRAKFGVQHRGKADD